MYKIVFFVALFFYCAVSSGQTYYPYQDIKLDKPSDYKDVEPIVIHAATSLLSTPFNKKNNDRERALTFIIKWMSGTKDYHFQVQGKAQDIIEDRDLFGLYTVAMAKYCIENKGLSGNTKIVESAVCKILLDYCDNPVNNFPLKKKQRKILDEK